MVLWLLEWRLSHSSTTSLYTAQLDDVQDVPPIPGPICQNGNVFLGYGSSAFIGLGFSVIVMLVIIEVSEQLCAECPVRVAMHCEERRLTPLSFSPLATQ